MEIKRKKFQGVLNILSFNRHFYIFGIAVLAIIVISHQIFRWSDIVFWIIIISFLYGLMMPLLVSAYVYDFSGYYNFKWLKKCKIDEPEVKQILNINAGFDETSFIIKNNFPNADLNVFDFYDAERHTEPAIIRARKVSLVYPNTQQMKSNSMEMSDHSVDLIFLLSAVHEIRSNDEKIQFLKECHRVCKPNGKIIMVEHLRDLPNFFAFSVGFTHFFSRKTWKNAFKNSGFTTFEEVKFTPFMSIFICKP
ncbi:methyltransferase domain-containing protein [Chryseobacterium aquaticum]|uniref:Methyltransferase domain-containing protein n=1 Tax=Chryseobacterium aquaticum TaxID=452084 RepID=A0A848MXY2_9FLAO|nr:MULTISPECIES: methyltransferase domain-containing protein [Chryseobacterium]NMR32976.1 methyltransferase domain-containing protein [Chryseobacterium aquaticum]NRQ45093.1 methyltransferase domain-containing protein [Chryseobacterium sp. C-204]